MDQISEYMKKQFHPKHFVVRERFRFWSDMKRKPVESIPEPAARIRQAAATCDVTLLQIRWTNPCEHASFAQSTMKQC